MSDNEFKGFTTSGVWLIISSLAHHPIVGIAAAVVATCFLFRSLENE